MKNTDNIEDVYTLSPLQQGMLFHSIFQKESSAYIVQNAYRLSGDLNIEAVQQSLEELIKRHDILRTSFVYEEMDKPLQIVLKHRELPFYVEDIQQMSSSEAQEQYLSDFKEKDKARYFDLTKDGLMRASIFRLGEHSYEFIWTFHHIIVDGWCQKTLEYEFFAIYENAKENKASELPRATQYKTYIQWLSEQSTETAEEYWLKYLSDYESAASIPQLKAHHKTVEAFNNNTHVFELDESLNEALSAMARRNRSTLNNVVRTIWGILLAKYNDQRDTIFGAVVSGRPPALKDADKIVGLFINTVPVRIAYDETMSFQKVLQKVTQETIDSEKFHHSPLADIQNLSELKQQLFDHILVFENYPSNPNLKGLSEEETPENAHFLQLLSEDVFSQNHYPFYIIIGTKPQLKFSIYYNKELYDEAQILRMCDHLTQLMEQCITNDQMEVEAMTLVKPNTNEYHNLLNGFNDTQQSFPLDQSVKSVFEQVAAQYPNQVAIHSSNGNYTYRELNERSNILANYMAGQFPESKEKHFVGILTRQTDNAIVAMLASLKVGAVFVPIHPDLPATNIQNILTETKVGFLCLESDRLGQVKYFSGELFAMDIQLDMLADSAGDLPDYPNSEDPLYTIYSSGTTGKPKGVMISNRSLLNYTYWFKDQFHFTKNNRGALLSSPAFDLGYTCIWGCLLSGASLYLVDQKIVREPDLMLDYLLEHQITFLKLTPSHFKIIMASSKKEALANSALQLILLGGEKIQTQSIEAFLKIKSTTQFVNHYGPTEATIGAIVHPINGAQLLDYSQAPLIGQPIANDKAYILDSQGNVLPVGAKGDLYLAGEGLAIGYLGNTSLTQQKFAKSSWGERLYQTGDKARRFPNGGIEFLGRADNEVKIRGYRVNLGEIEQILQQHPFIDFANVQSFESQSGDISLTAFVQWNTPVEMDSFQAKLKDQLPEYMVPSEFVMINEIPITENGKLNVKKLRKEKSNQEQRVLIAPQNENEEKLLKIWKHVLEKEQMSTEDDFFDLGGHSLKAVQIISRIIVDFKITLAVKDIFDNTTIRKLAEELERQSSLQGSDESLEEILI